MSLLSSVSESNLSFGEDFSDVIGDIANESAFGSDCTIGMSFSEEIAALEAATKTFDEVEDDEFDTAVKEDEEEDAKIDEELEEEANTEEENLDEILLAEESALENHVDVDDAATEVLASLDRLVPDEDETDDAVADADLDTF